MDIKEFVKTTLSQLHEAVKESSSELRKDIYIANSVRVNTLGPIEFDLAVEATNTKSTDLKGGLRIHVVETGASKAAASTSSTTSRIKFIVYANFNAQGTF